MISKFIKSLLYLGVIISLTCIFVFPAYAREPVVNAKGAVLIDGKTGQVLWEKEAYTPLPPASTSKILTTITLLDNVDISQNCTISPMAAAVGESSIHLRTGEELTIEDLLWGALLHSGNDACYAMGEWFGGSEDFFVHLLNMKTAAMGGLSASLENTNGLPNENHLISPYDLALCTRNAMANSMFAQMVATKEKTFGEGPSSRHYKNTNKLLFQSEAIIGVKTGTTNSAGACLVTAMEKDDKMLIAVVFNSPDRYGESLALLDYGMENFEYHSYAQQKELCGYIPNLYQKTGFWGGQAQEYLPMLAVNAGSFLYPKEGGNLQVRYSLPAGISNGQPGDIIGNIIFEDEHGMEWHRINIELGGRSSPN